MSVRLAIGVDPSSTATGVVFLGAEVREATVGVQTVPFGVVPASVQLLGRKTLRPKGATLTERLRRLHALVGDLFEAWCSEPGVIARLTGLAYPLLVAVEDPTDFPYAGKRRSGRTVGQVGAAFGTVLAATDVLASLLPGGVCCDVIGVPSQAWLPQTRTKGRRHPMKHVNARRLLRDLYPALGDTTDDETFAAGVALHALTGNRLAAL